MFLLKLFKRHSSCTIFLYDSVCVIIAWFFSYYARFDFQGLPSVIFFHAVRAQLIVLIVQIVFYIYYHTYRPLLRFSSLPEIFRLIKAVFFAWVVSIIFSAVIHDLNNVPMAVWIFYPLLLIVVLCFPRMFVRYFNKRHKSEGNKTLAALIIGGGNGAELFLRDIERWPKKKYEIKGILDDDKRLRGKEIRGIKILGGIKEVESVAKEKKIEMIIIAIPSIGGGALKIIVDECNKTELPLQILPSLEEIASGKFSIGDTRSISLEDLLGRSPIRLNWESLHSLIDNQIILVTGGAGSIGSELCRQILWFSPKLLLIADHSEFGLYKIEQELRDMGIENFKIQLLDITNKEEVNYVFQKFRPDLIFHAAAYKHVPILEEQTRHAIKNNMLGTRVLAEAAANVQVKKFVMVSTDKAVNPTSVLGITKRLAELFCLMFHPEKTKFLTVRFGNVLGSTGSVIPLFKQQIANGGPITVTHPEVTRYFMTISEAAQLILQAAAIGNGSEIFVLDMGNPIKIIDLARQLIRLSGKSEQDIKIEYTGLRPGEKIHEDLFYSRETFFQTEQEKILKANTSLSLTWSEIKHAFENIEQMCFSAEERVLQKYLKNVLNMSVE